MFDLDITSSWPVLSLAFALVIFLVYWFITNYRNAYYTKTIKLILLVLRSCALILFIILLTDLKIETTRHTLVKRDVAFLWDMSQSMPLADSSYAAKDILTSKEYKELSKLVTVRHISNMRDPGFVSESRLKQLPVNEPLSDNAKLIRFAEKQAMFDDIVLVSDGRSYLGERIETIDLASGIHVHAIGIGKPKQSTVPEIRALTHPRMMFDDDSLTLRWYLYNPADEAFTGMMTLNVDGKEILKRNVSVPGERMIPFSETFEPMVSGRHEWQFFVENSGRKISIAKESFMVHDSRVKIVYAGDPPDQDIAMIVTVLRQNDQYRLLEQEEWDRAYGDHKPDLIIQTWHPDTRPQIDPEVPSLLIYRDNKDTYAFESDLLIKEQRPYLYFAKDPVDNSLYWKQLPPIQIARFMDRGKVVMKSKNDRPVIMEDRQHHAMILNASGIWRWNLAGYEKEWDGIYRHMIAGMAKTLLWQFGNTYLALDETIYKGKEYETLPVAVRRTDQDQLDRENTIVQLTLFDSGFVEISRQEFGHDKQTTDLVFERRGSYYLTADLFLNDILMESDTANILIEKNNMETRDPGCDEKALQTLADDHHGHYLHASDLNGLASMVPTDKKWIEVTEIFIARQAYVLYALMFLLLCADWVIRKRSGGI